MKNDLKADLVAATRSVTKSWKRAKRSADRNDRVSRGRINRMRYAPPRITVREVAFRVMEEAYNKASSNGKYYANARQIMYAARPAILAECDASQFDSVYFTQTLLKDYLELKRPGWKVVWDARGHLVEPFTGEKVALGGLGVKKYMDAWHSNIDMEVPAIKRRIDTKGPRHRFSSVLFIEKEGFAEILADAGIPERYDMAIMSTKGIPVDAACDLIEAMDHQGVRIFVLHDFDLVGFKILRTLREGTRLSWGTQVIDLGLRLADIEGLPSEPVYYSQKTHPGFYLTYYCGATDEEGKFLVEGPSGYRGWQGRRVEINAMTSEQLITWLERKFDEHGVEKVVPPAEILDAAYKRAVFLQRIEAEIEKIQEELKENEPEMQEEIRPRVGAIMEVHPHLSWDAAVWAIVEEDTK